MSERSQATTTSNPTPTQAMTTITTTSNAAHTAASLLRALGFSPAVVGHMNDTSITVDVPGIAEVLIDKTGVVVAINRLDGDAAAQLDALAS